MNDILVRIEELRAARGLSKLALASKIGVTPTTLSNWSRTDSIPSLSVIERICEATDTDFETFFCGLGNSERNAQNEFIDGWRMLSPAERVAVERVVDAFWQSKGEVSRD